MFGAVDDPVSIFKAVSVMEPSNGGICEYRRSCDTQQHNEHFPGPFLCLRLRTLDDASIDFAIQDPDTSSARNEELRMEGVWSRALLWSLLLGG